ncbi:MAG TPA: TetR/AcrR family transcriptional regulator [Acetobacteraceae bacterium]|nr:TetR/AcrR family transcriptional regulator [Acetobacteraceae bacterium]
MPFAGRQGYGRDSYHHGNLREALIAAALRLIAEHGPAGFSFAEVARAADVSPAAPYRHFRDRNALLAEIARRGFDGFSAALEAAWDEGRPDPVTAIEACGHAYLDFARRERASYAAMFESDLPISEDPALLAASERAFSVLRRAADAACRTMPGATRPPALMVALHLWSLSHGIASLFVGRADGVARKLPMAPEELLEAGMLIYLQALGLPRGAGGG